LRDLPKRRTLGHYARGRILNAHANLVTLANDVSFLPIDLSIVALENDIGLFAMNIEFIDITTFKAIVTCDIHLVSSPWLIFLILHNIFLLHVACIHFMCIYDAYICMGRLKVKHA
jgi:hypothetical protein